MQIRVETSTNVTVLLDVEPTDSVHTVKCKLQSKLNVPCEKLLLLFPCGDGDDELSVQEQQLLLQEAVSNDDEQTLDHYKIQSGATVRCVICLTLHVFGEAIAAAATSSPLTLHVAPTASIYQLKSVIQQRAQIMVDEQLLTSCSGRRLQYGYTLTDYQLPDDSRIRLDTLPPSPEFSVRVTTVTQRSVDLDVVPWDTIETIKCKIADKMGVDVGRQRLICRGKCLENQRTVSDYSIAANSVLWLVVRRNLGGA